MSTVKAFIVAACCGLMLLGAVSAHAGITRNGLGRNGVQLNRINFNGIALNGLRTNGLRNQGLLVKESKRPGGSTSAVQSESLPFNGLSQSGLGKMRP
jgi:hypothetical protein